jgi:hypothetical protein
MAKQYRNTHIIDTVRPEIRGPLAQCVTDADALNAIFAIVGKGRGNYVDIGVGSDSANCPMHGNLFDLGWNGLLVEHTASVANGFMSAFAGRNNITVVHKKLEFPRDNGQVDSLVSQWIGTERLDLLGLRLYGPEYQAWEDLSISPRIVAVRFNPTIPANIEYVQEDGEGVRKGCSLLALVELGHRLGYELAYVGELAVFVNKDEFAKLGIDDNSIETLWRDDSWLTPIMIGYNGRIVTTGGRLLWNRIGSGQTRFCEDDVQPLPAAFQTLFPT